MCAVGVEGSGEKSHRTIWNEEAGRAAPPAFGVLPHGHCLCFPGQAHILQPPLQLLHCTERCTHTHIHTCPVKAAVNGCSCTRVCVYTWLLNECGRKSKTRETVWVEPGRGGPDFPFRPSASLGWHLSFTREQAVGLCQASSYLAPPSRPRAPSQRLWVSVCMLCSR